MACLKHFHNSDFFNFTELGDVKIMPKSLRIIAINHADILQKTNNQTLKNKII